MSKPIERVEIITGIRRRRRYTAEEKARLVEQTMQPGMTVSAATGRFPVKAVADTLGVARSHFVDHLRRPEGERVVLLEARRADLVPRLNRHLVLLLLDRQNLLCSVLYPAHKGLTLGVDPTRLVVIHRRAWLRGADHAGANDPGRRAAG